MIRQATHVTCILCTRYTRVTHVTHATNVTNVTHGYTRHTYSFHLFPSKRRTADVPQTLPFTSAGEEHVHVRILL